MKSRITGLLVLSVLAVAACTQKPESSVSVQKAQGSATPSGIVGGEAVTPAQKNGALILKSTVALMTTDDAGDIQSFCSGTLIAPDLVLTAGHCAKAFSASEIKVFFGATLPKSTADEGLVQVAESLVNPDYDRDVSRFNDVALLKLQKSAPVGFEPVSILEPSYVLKAGAEILLAGYGVVQDNPDYVRTLVLNLVRVHVAEVDEDNKIIVTDQNSGHGACAGDSGGPSYLESDSGLLVFGDTRGPHPGSEDCEHFGEYTYAAKFKEFILAGAKTLGTGEPVFKLP